MSSISQTAIVYNQPNKIVGLPEYYYRWRVCNTNLNGNTPADQYQKLKLIQNTVRVNSSLYTSNLGPLESYKRPDVATYGVCWNQMSDRPVPSVQRATIPTGSNTSLNRRHTSVTSSRPGCQTPGGVGCDIKHNSYDRYLNRLKGKGPLRRGVVPTDFGAPIPFNRALPVYGGKTMKTNIVNGCDCPIAGQATNLEADERIYNDPLWQPLPVSEFSFKVGDYVYAIQTGNTFYTRAVILSITDGVYTIQFDNGVIQTVNNANSLLIYFPCNCGGIIDGTLYQSGFLSQINNTFGSACILPNYASYISQFE
jgi:hypothetical protein